MTSNFIKTNEITHEEMEAVKEKGQTYNQKYEQYLTPEILLDAIKESESFMNHVHGKHEKSKNKILSLITLKELKKLHENWHENQERLNNGEDTLSFAPVIKLFNPIGIGTWYISELSDDLMGYGICHLYEYELGYVSLDELSSIKLKFGYSIEKDVTFSGNKKSLRECLELLEDGACL